MPAKRPPPLADSALFPQGRLPTGPLDARVGGEAHGRGLALQIKNTFIDVPSSSSLHSAHAAGKLPQQSAPAELSLEPGFIGRALCRAPGLGDPEDEKIRPIGTPSSPRMSSNRSAQTNKAPGSGLSTSSGIGASLAASTGLSTPLATPSPTGHALGLFSTIRQQQLFSAAAPTQETQNPALTPHNGSSLGFIGTPTNGSQGKSPRTASWLNSTMPAAPPGFSTGVSYSSALPYRPAAEAAKASQLDAVEQGASSKADEDSIDSDAEDGLPAKGMEDAPKPPPGAEHPSLGSQAHDQGTCKRCCFYPRNRCLNGYNCDFCHYDHEKRKRKSKKKKKKSDKDGTGDGQGGSDDEATIGGHLENGLQVHDLPHLAGATGDLPLSMLASALQAPEYEVSAASYYAAAAGHAEPVEVQPTVASDSGQILSTPAPPMNMQNLYMSQMHDLCNQEMCSSVLDMAHVEMGHEAMMMWPPYESYDASYDYTTGEHAWMASGSELVYEMDPMGLATGMSSADPLVLPSVLSAPSYASSMPQDFQDYQHMQELAERHPISQSPAASFHHPSESPPSLPPPASPLPILEETHCDLAAAAPPLCSPKLPKELFTDSSDEEHPKDQTHSKISQIA